MRMASTRCTEDFRFSVPDNAWLTSSSVDSRRASRPAVAASPFGFAAGISSSSRVSDLASYVFVLDENLVNKLVTFPGWAFYRIRRRFRKKRPKYARFIRSRLDGVWLATT